MLRMVLLLPLSLVIDIGELDHGGGSGGGGGPTAVTVAVVAAVENRDRWRWLLMAAAALDGGHARTSWCSERAAQQEDKRECKERQ